MDFTNIKTFNDLLDAKYGKPESPERKKFEQKAFGFYLKQTMTDKSREINKTVDSLISNGTYHVETLRKAVDINNPALLRLTLTLANGYEVSDSTNVFYTEEDAIGRMKHGIRQKLCALEEYKQH